MSVPRSPISLPHSKLGSAQSTIRCQTCGYSGFVLTAHHGYKWWALPVGFLLACTGIGLLPLAVILILLGNRTFNACPKCMGRNLADWKGAPSPESQAIWARAKEADDKAFQKNKLILLGVVLTILAAALVFMVVMLRRV
jgi:hypothetical protein